MAYIVIVDDDQNFASAVAKVLHNEGHETKIELQISRALKNMEERVPDLAILDVMFPEDPSAGFEMARTIKKNQALKDIPGLMLTGVNATFPLGFGPKDINETWFPISDFLEKPIDFDVLLTKVSSLLGQT